MFRAVQRAFAALRERRTFRLIQYSVQGNHVHLIAEADDRTALVRGAQALVIRLAFAINRAHSRRGRVFADRYYARALKTPLEVRRALIYVLRNERKHSQPSGWLPPPWHFDSCSSARDFDGWQRSALLELALRRSGPLTRAPAAVTTSAQCYLLRTGWRRHGLLLLDETPRA